VDRDADRKAGCDFRLSGKKRGGSWVDKNRIKTADGVDVKENSVGPDKAVA